MSGYGTCAYVYGYVYVYVYGTCAYVYGTCACAYGYVFVYVYGKCLALSVDVGTYISLDAVFKYHLTAVSIT